MIKPLNGFLESLPKPFLFAFGFALVMVVGGLDLLSGTAMRFALLYLVPIVLVSWYAGAAAGGAIALFSVFYGLLAEFATDRSSIGVPAPWDRLLVPCGVFLLAAVAVAQLRLKLDRLLQMATLDSLTGLPNAQAFFELMARETEQCGGLNPLTLVYVDLGGVERINRSLGHATGDQVLCTIGQVIKQSIPRQQLMGRVGGTTFAVLLPNASSETAKATIRQLQAQLHETRGKSLLAVTFSISAMTCAKAPRTVAGLMHEAESRLRRSKARHHDALNIVQIDSASALH